MYPPLPRKWGASPRPLSLRGKMPGERGLARVSLWESGALAFEPELQEWSGVGRMARTNPSGWVAWLPEGEAELPSPCPEDSLLLVTFLPCGSAGKESACSAGDLGSIPGLRRSAGEGKGYPLPCSGLENSMDCIVCGVRKSRTRLSDSHFASLHIANDFHG